MPHDLGDPVGNKIPRHVAFVKQANIAHGPQQVNNATGQKTGLRAHGKFSNRTIGGARIKRANLKRRLPVGRD